MEIWKEIDGSDDAWVSNLGRVRRHGKIVKTIPDMDGYPRVTVGGQRKRDRVYRLVAEAFVPNPEGKPIVNHKDGCKNHCYAENLEWMTVQENNTHARQTGLATNGPTRWVAAKHISGDTVLIFPNQCAAGRALGISDKGINKNLRGKRKTTHGYIFCYLKDQAAFG